MFRDRKSTTCGVIGLGIIGDQVANNLRKARVHTYVWNRTPKSVPNFLGSPADMANRTRTIQIFVTNGKALDEIVKAMLINLTPEHIILNHSTIGLDETKRIADLVHTTGAKFLDAPFTGSKKAAETGDLVYYLSGDEKAIHSVTPLLQISGKELIPFGDIGNATMLKLATNMISVSTVQALSEALALINSQGIDPQMLIRAIEQNACRSTVSDMKLASMIENETEAHFSLKNMCKDSLYALNLARKSGLEFPVLAGAAGVMAEEIRKGNSEKDFSVISQKYLQNQKKEDGEDNKAKEETKSKK